MTPSRAVPAKSRSRPKFDPGSFKDPEGRVCIVGSEVFRTLSPAAAERMSELAAAGILDALAEKSLLVDSQLTSAAKAGLDPRTFSKSLLRHERIPLVSYPYEWSFSMLREAALTTLSGLEFCLERELILKDATAYNVTLHRGRMMFFDTLSIDRYKTGTPWEGYAQFCREFLFPLMLTSYRGVDFNAWFRGRLSGISVGEMSQLFRRTDMFRRGVLRHVHLQAKLEQSFANKDVKVRDRFDASNFSKDLILANLRNIRRLIEGLSYTPKTSEWIGYVCESSYSDDDTRVKSEFVERALKRLRPRTVVDLGCNTGTFSFIAADHAERVTAIDIDTACIDVLFQKIRSEGRTNIVSMVGDLLNPSPDLGWNLRERSALYKRIGSDAFLALALIHHVCIGGNVPLAAFLDQLREIAPGGVIEWVGKDDRMVTQMLRNRADVFHDYDWQNFARLVKQRFNLSDVLESHGGARKLCLLEPRKS